MKNPPFKFVFCIFFLLGVVIASAFPHPEPPDVIKKQDIAGNTHLVWGHQDWVITLKKNGDYECVMDNSKWEGFWDIKNNTLYVVEINYAFENLTDWKLWECKLVRHKSKFIGITEGVYGKINIEIKK